MHFLQFYMVTDRLLQWPQMFDLKHKVIMSQLWLFLLDSRWRCTSCRSATALWQTRLI